MLPKKIEIILIFFDLCGFKSGSTILFNSQKLKNCITILHISAIALMTVDQFVFYYKFYFTFGLLETVNDLVVAMISLSTYYLIILDANLNQRAHKCFWTVFQQINGNFGRHFNLTFRCYIAKVIAFFSLTTTMIIMRSICYNSKKHATFIIMANICQIRILYYLLCLEVVHFQWIEIEREFEAMRADLFIRKPNILSHDLEKLKRICAHIYCVYKMMNALNDIFGLSNVATISYCFFCLFTDINYWYLHCHEMALLMMFGKYLHFKNLF